jgi:hypothetical protein
MSIPKTVIKAIDRRRRAFFWTGEDVCHGSKCLVAWDNVCASKTQGGLGVKDLELQNRCLLMKFIDKLFSDEDASWKDWITRDTTIFETPAAGSNSYLWRIINDELSAYRSITTVTVRNGASTSFWFDDWLPDGPLNLSHAALFSHTTRPNISVQDVFHTGFDLRLRPRLTNAASAQLASLLMCLQGITLQDAPDQRAMKLTGKPFTTRSAYSALDSNQGPPDIHGQRIWSSRVPNKVKIFSWLYFKDQLSTRSNLHAKHVLDDDQCQRCTGVLEDRRHVFFGCPISSGVRIRLNLSNVASLSDVDAWNADVPPNLDAKLWPFILQTLLWRLWDARNGEIFRNERPSSRSIISKVCDDLVIWRKRFRDDFDVTNLNNWRSFLLCCNTSDLSTIVEL